MKGLKKLALATAVATVPFAAHAELKAMDDSTMGAVTGQAGITIELDANVSIGEIAYHDDSDSTDGVSDGGFLAINGLTLGGATPGTALDNVLVNIDIAGASGAAGTATQAFGSTYLSAAAAASGGTVTWTDTNAGRDAGMPTVQDGDLVIGIRSTDHLPLDYGLGIGSVSLAKSDATVGNLDAERRANGGTSTTLVSDLYIAGLLGPIDIVIQEDTDVMNINAYFNAQGTLNADFVGTSMGFALHNSRGADNNLLTSPAGSTSFAHAQVDIGLGTAKETSVAGTEVLAFNVNDFSGDLDLTDITMGSAPSIGSVYMTDLSVNAQMNVYGH